MGPESIGTAAEQHDNDHRTAAIPDLIPDPLDVWRGASSPHLNRGMTMAITDPLQSRWYQYGWLVQQEPSGAARANDRVGETEPAQDHREPRRVPHRRRADEAALPGSTQHQQEVDDANSRLESCTQPFYDPVRWTADSAVNRIPVYTEFCTPPTSHDHFVATCRGKFRKVTLIARRLLSQRF